MLLKLIACNVFTREACWCIAQSPHVVDVEFTELGEHVHPEALRARIQGVIDAAEGQGKQYDAVLVLFGICGNAGVGLQARGRKLVMPRAHDCCTILLGSRATFAEHFKDDPSTPFGSAGYLERGDYFLRTEDGETTVYYGDVYAQYVEQYGEENAKYIWETMHPSRPEGNNRAVFINVPETTLPAHEDSFRQQAEAEGKDYIRLDGSLALIRALICGDWNGEDFLVVEPGQEVAGVYDWSEVIRTKPAA